MKFSIKDFFIKCNQICSKLQIWSHLLKKSLMENSIQCWLCKERLFWIYSNIETNTSALPLSESRSILKIFRRKCETKYHGSICIRGTLYKVFGYNFGNNIFLLILVWFAIKKRNLTSSTKIPHKKPLLTPPLPPIPHPHFSKDKFFAQAG